MTMNDLKEKILKFAKEAQRYLSLAHLTSPQHWLMVLAPTMGALFLAFDRAPAIGTTLGLLMVTLSLWGIAWSFNDLMNARGKDQAHSLIMQGVVTATQAAWFISALTLVSLVIIFLLGYHFTTITPLAMVVVFAFPWLRRRTYLIDAWAGLGIAWTVPMAYAAVGHWPDKLGALLGVVTLLWATGWSVLKQWPRQNELMARGMRSFGMMFGTSTGYVVVAMQAAVLIGAWMAAGQARLSTVYAVALWICAALIAYQSLLIFRRGITASKQALTLHTLAGTALWLGVAIQIISAT